MPWGLIMPWSELLGALAIIVAGAGLFKLRGSAPPSAEAMRREIELHRARVAREKAGKP